MQSAASAADDNACSLYSSLQARCANTPEGCSNQQAVFVDMGLQASVTCILFQIDNSLECLDSLTSRADCKKCCPALFACNLYQEDTVWF